MPGKSLSDQGKMLMEIGRHLMSLSDKEQDSIPPSDGPGAKENTEAQRQMKGDNEARKMATALLKRKFK